MDAVMKIDGNKVSLYFLGLLPLSKCTYFSLDGLLRQVPLDCDNRKLIKKM